MEKHFTATVYVIEDEKVLLLLHPKHNKWLPPGGHLEKNETPVACALREVLEETGIAVELIKEEHLWIDRYNAVSTERPFLCLIENIPAYKDVAAHQHIDFIFVGRPLSKPILNERLRWFTLDEALALKPDEEIFAETQETISVILEKYCLKGHNHCL
jgi:8-oxo-dGTP pyrophosphatase MutT (NUDIX family)